MSIKVTDDREFVGFWFAPLPVDSGDFLAAVSRKRGSQEDWHFAYRFRYYRGGAPSEDEMSWWTARFPAHYDTAAICAVVARVAAQAGLVLDFVDLSQVTTAQEMFERVAGRAWAHVLTTATKGTT